MKSSAERQKEYRERKKAGQTGDWQVKALTEEIRALEARVTALEGKTVPTVIPNGASNLALKGDALAQLRAQIAAVPPVREPVVIQQRFGTSTNEVSRPFGDWESA